MAWSDAARRAALEVRRAHTQARKTKKKLRNAKFSSTYVGLSPVIARLLSRQGVS